MKQNTAAWLILGGLCVTLSAICNNTWKTDQVSRDIQVMMRHVTMRKTTMTSEWKSLGTKLVYATHLGEVDVEETNQQHATRHRSGFDAMLAVFPKE